MKKRLYKKKVKNMPDDELIEQVIYIENKRFLKIAEKEFDKRFIGVMERNKQISEAYSGVSYETDLLWSGEMR